MGGALNVATRKSAAPVLTTNAFISTDKAIVSAASTDKQSQTPDDREQRFLDDRTTQQLVLHGDLRKAVMLVVRQIYNHLNRVS
jgi:hypothetical protein